MSESVTAVGVLIVGAGQAACELAFNLRQGGYTGTITMVGDEPYLPYRRPPLSKTFLAGEATLESLYIKQAPIFEKNTIECRTGVRVVSIDRAAKQVTLADGSLLGYEWLVLATGGRPRSLPMPGADKPNVHYVRTIQDIQALKEGFEAGRRLVIIGGGYIGLEAAAVAIKKGLKVTVVEAFSRVLGRVTAPEISAFYERVHREQGVDLRTGVGLAALEGDARVDTVVLADGSRIEADSVIVGIGLVPNTELASDAGLAIDNGIVADAYTRTADPAILAIGDCSNHENVFLGYRLRLESVPNAMEQARVAAATIQGKAEPYRAVPWFWSDQYDLKLQMVGLSQGYEQLVVRGDMAKNSFLAFYMKGNQVLAADSINRMQEFGLVKRLVAEKILVDPAVLADESVAIKSLLPA